MDHLVDGGRPLRQTTRDGIRRKTLGSTNLERQHLPIRKIQYEWCSSIHIPLYLVVVYLTLDSSPRCSFFNNATSPYRKPREIPIPLLHHWQGE